MIEIVTEQNDDDPVETALAEFAAAWYEGEKPDVDRFLQTHAHCGPELSRRVREFISTAEILRLGQSGARSGRVRGGVTGELLGEFRIIREVGRGGMGVVYLAEQRSLRRHVAIKVLPAHLTLRADTVERFRREASTAASLRHPGIVEIHSVGEQNGTHYFAMAFVEGTGLDRVIEHVRAEPLDRLTGETIGAAVSHHVQLNQSDVLPRRDEHLRQAKIKSPVWNKTYIETVCRLIVQIAEALDHAHKAGVIHRDVKPSNILVREDGVAVLTDFGLAREQGLPSLTLTGEFAGTPDYVSPEQAVARRAGIDHRTDIYSLGVTLFELLTLRRPFEGLDSQEILHKIRTKEPPPPRKFNPMIPRDLQTIVLKAIEKDPSRRYQDMAAFAADLRALLEYRPVTARPTSPVTRMLKLATRHRGSVTAGGLACAAILALFAYRWTRASYLHIQCDVEDAAIWLDGREVGRTTQAGSMQLEVTPGSHTVRATKGIDASKPTAVRVSRGDSQPVPLTLISGSGLLVLESNPSGALVTITKDGVEQGQFPTPSSQRLAAGHYDAVFALSGFKSKHESVEVPNEGHPKPLRHSWDTGELELQGLQDGIQVEIFGPGAGAHAIQTLTLPSATPLRLPVGDYRIIGRLRNHDWRIYDGIEVDKDQKTVAALWLPPIVESAPFARVRSSADPFVIVADLEGDGIPEIIVAQQTGELAIHDSRGGLKFQGALCSSRTDAIRSLVTCDSNNDGHLDIVAATWQGVLTATDHRAKVTFEKLAIDGRTTASVASIARGGKPRLVALVVDPGVTPSTTRLVTIPLTSSDVATELPTSHREFNYVRGAHHALDDRDVLVAWGNQNITCFDDRCEPLWEQQLSSPAVIGDLMTTTASGYEDLGIVTVIAGNTPEPPHKLIGWSYGGKKRFEVPLNGHVDASVTIGATKSSRVRVIVATDESALIGFDDSGNEVFLVKTPGRVQRLVAADLDGSHVLEVFATTSDGRAVAYQLDGTVRCTLDVKAKRIFASDLNGDGEDELIVLTATRDLKIFGVRRNTSFAASVSTPSRFATGDLDGDGHSEIALADGMGTITVLAHDGTCLVRSVHPLRSDTTPVPLLLHSEIPRISEVVTGALGGQLLFRVDTQGTRAILDVKVGTSFLAPIDFNGDGRDFIGIGTRAGRAIVANSDGELFFDRSLQTLSSVPNADAIKAMAMIEVAPTERCIAVLNGLGQMTWFNRDRSIRLQQDISIDGHPPAVGHLIGARIDHHDSRLFLLTDASALLFDAEGRRYALRVDGKISHGKVADLDHDGNDEIILISQSTDARSTWSSQLSVFAADGHRQFQLYIGTPVQSFVVGTLTPSVSAIVLQAGSEMIVLDATGSILQRERFPGTVVSAPVVADLDGDGAAEYLVSTDTKDTVATTIVHQDGSRRLLSDHSVSVGVIQDEALQAEILCYDPTGGIESIHFDASDPRRLAQRKFLEALDAAERSSDAAAEALFAQAGLRWLTLDDAKLASIRARLALARSPAAKRMASLLNEVRPAAEGEWLDAVLDLVRAGRTGDAALVMDEHAASQLDENLAPKLNDIAWSIVEPHSPDHDAREIGLRLARDACTLTHQANPNALSTLAEAEFLTSHFREAVRVGEEALEKCPPEPADRYARLTADLARYRAALKQ